MLKAVNHSSKPFCSLKGTLFISIKIEQCVDFENKYDIHS